jgi:RNA polymerase sigma factor (sigma-70 family)
VSAFPSPLPSPATASPGAKDVADSGGTVFNEVMAAYSGLVFSTALRKLAGDAEGAREVTQNVFLMAFRKREVLATLAYPAAWFHRAAMLESSNFLRLESRRRKHLEAWTAEQSVVHDEASAGLSEVLRAHLDEALHGLREPERELILSRFFEGRSFQELAERHRSTPDAVRMKLTRILEKLSSVLKHQGVTVTIAALASGLGAQWSHAAPAGLGAAVTAAASTSAAVTASKLPILLGAMTSMKSVALTLCAILLTLFSLRSQSLRIDDLKTKLEQRWADEDRAPDSKAAGKASVLHGGNGFVGKGNDVAANNENSGRVSGRSLLLAMQKRQDMDYGNDMFFWVLRLDERMKKMTREELMELLSEIDSLPAGAGIKCHARAGIIRVFLAEKDPAAAIEQAIRYRMPDDTFLKIARRWTAQETADGGGTFHQLLENAERLPPGKFGSDAAGAIRQGVAQGLAGHDLASSITLCREAAATPAGGDYLLGIVGELAKKREYDTLLELLKTVTDAEMVARISKASATAFYRWNAGPDFQKFVEETAADPALRRQMVLDTAVGIFGSNGEVNPDVLKVIGNGSSGRENQQILMTLLRQNDPPRQPFLSNKQEMLANDLAMEKALRSVASEDPVLAQQWLLGISDSALRGKLAIDLNLQP